MMMMIINLSLNILHVHPKFHSNMSRDYYAQSKTCFSFRGAQTVEIPEEARTRTEFISVLNVKTYLGMGFATLFFLTLNLQVIMFSSLANNRTTN
jgi:hypothetical protein